MGAAHSNAFTCDDEGILGVPTLSKTIQSEVCLRQPFEENKDRVWLKGNSGNHTREPMEGSMVPRADASKVRRLDAICTQTLYSVFTSKKIQAPGGRTAAQVAHTEGGVDGIGLVLFFYLGSLGFSINWLYCLWKRFLQFF